MLLLRLVLDDMWQACLRRRGRQHFVRSSRLAGIVLILIALPLWCGQVVGTVQQRNSYNSCSAVRLPLYDGVGADVVGEALSAAVGVGLHDLAWGGLALFDVLLCLALGAALAVNRGGLLDLETKE